MDSQTSQQIRTARRRGKDARQASRSKHLAQSVTHSRSGLGLLIALAGACLWGFSGVCIQYLQQTATIDPLIITCVRAITASVLFIVVIAVRYRAQLKRLFSNPKTVALTCLFGLGLFSSQSTYAISTGITNADTATVLQMLSSVFVLLFTCLRMKSAPKVREIMAILFALMATWLIATKGDLGSLNIPAAGLAWGIVNALAVTLYLMVPGKLYEEFPSVLVIGCGMCVSAVIATIVCLATSGGSADVVGTALSMDAFSWLTLVGGTGVLGTFAAFGMYLWGAALIGPVKGSLVGVAEPASACVLSVLLLGTAFTGADWVGFAFMAAMMVLIALPSRGKTSARDEVSEHSKVSESRKRASKRNEISAHDETEA